MIRNGSVVLGDANYPPLECELIWEIWKGEQVIKTMVGTLYPGILVDRHKALCDELVKRYDKFWGMLSVEYVVNMLVEYELLAKELI